MTPKVQRGLVWVWNCTTARPCEVNVIVVIKFITCENVPLLEAQKQDGHVTAVSFAKIDKICVLYV